MFQYQSWGTCAAWSRLVWFYLLYRIPSSFYLYGSLYKSIFSLNKLILGRHSIHRRLNYRGQFLFPVIVFTACLLVKFDLPCHSIYRAYAGLHEDPVKSNDDRSWKASTSSLERRALDSYRIPFYTPFQNDLFCHCLTFQPLYLYLSIYQDLDNHVITISDQDRRHKALPALN